MDFKRGDESQVQYKLRYSLRNTVMPGAAGKYLKMFTYKEGNFSHFKLRTQTEQTFEAPEGNERLAWLFELDLLSYTELKYSLCCE